VPLDLSAIGRIPRRRSARRLLQISAVASRRLLPVLATNPLVRDREHRQARVGRALALGVTELGVTFVKLGQLFASSPSIAGPTLAEAMRGVLDDGPAIPFTVVRSIVEADLGRSLEEVFASFERAPFAAASLAVVHRATLLDGRVVAVKVLRPTSARCVATDLSLLRPVVRQLARWAPVGVMPVVPDVVEGLAEQLAEELDLRNEARAMRWFDQAFAVVGAKGVCVPATVPEASGQQVLTMAYIVGSKVDDLVALAAADVDGRAAIKALLEAWFAVSLCVGVFHGDVHAGNLLLTPDGQVALLDWGIVGRLPAASHAFLRRSLEGALGDETAWPEVLAHVLLTLPEDLLATVGLSPDDVLQLVRMQTLMIMTSPFRELDLMMLAPGAALPGAPATAPTGLVGWLRQARQERRKMKAAGWPEVPSPPRGEMLLMKQLVFFERYGKLFLGDEPLIFDPDVYRSLLALTADP
jgi:predicted unusual protein kinase regulating ubiquinone biosynthesis (AarF/ABC1/UbiB family)